MTKRFYLIISTTLVLMLLASAVFASTIVPTIRNGVFQENFVPTPTYLPLDDDFAFTLETLSMTDDSIHFDDQEIDGFQFTDFTYVTHYPLGLEFTATITPPEDAEVVSINLVYRFAGGSQGRVRATNIDPENGVWQAIPYEARGLAPWMPMDVVWRVAYGEEGLVETEPVNVMYIDATRDWFRAESEDVIVYWFDFPEEMGEVVVTAFAHLREKFALGFGGGLSFKPTVVIFPPGDSMGEFQAGGQINPRTTGQASNETYSAVLRVRGLEIEEIRQDCIWNEPRDLEWQMRFAASVATHEVAHLYQFDYGVRATAWWIEGEATFFELEMGPVDQRLQRLAALGEDLATLQGSGPSGMVGTPASDGCTHLGYEMGASFINWLVGTYGGLDTHRQVIELVSSNVVLDDALEQVTGVPFIELERQWRAYIGLNPDPDIPPTQAYQFPPTSTPFGQ